MSSDVARDRVGDVGTVTTHAPATSPVRPHLSLLVGALRGIWALDASVWFLLLAVPMGLFLVLLLPPFQGQDEPYHFFRAYSISNGVLVDVSQGGHAGATMENCVSQWAMGQWMPARQPITLDRSQFLVPPPRCDPRAVSFVAFESTAIYSPLPYLPQAAAVGVARAAGLSVPLQFYAGRFAAFAVYLAIVFAALRLAPSGRSLLLVVGLLPMSLLVAATYSADTMVISLVLLLVALTLRCIQHPQAGLGTFAAATAVASGLALTKPTYNILALVLLLVPSRVISGKFVTALAAKVVALGIVAALSLAWYLQIRHVSLVNFVMPYAGVPNPRAQIAYIVDHPLGYLRYVADLLFSSTLGAFPWNTFIAIVGYWRSGAKGSPFPPLSVTVIGCALLVQAFLREIPQVRAWSVRRAAVAALPPLLVAANALFIVTVLFVEGVGPGGYLHVDGRYFIPLLPVPLVSLAAVASGPSRVRSVLPLVPWVLIMYVWLGLKVNSLFYT